MAGRRRCAFPRRSWAVVVTEVKRGNGQPLGDGSAASLRDQAVASAKWVTLGRLIVEGSSFVALLVLARLLRPSEVGNAAVAMVVYALAMGLASGSFGSPLVKMVELDRAAVATARLLSLIFGAAMSLLALVIGLALEPVIGHASGEMVALASPTFLFASIAAVPQAVRTRTLAFQAVMVFEMVGAIAGAAVSIALALSGSGAASMVMGWVTTTAVVALMAPLGLALPRPTWHREAATGIATFGAWSSASSLCFIATRNIDYALLSGRMPAAQVGYYFRAFTLAVDYQGKISNIVLRVLFPLLSRATSGESFRAARRRVVRLHSVVLFPLLAILLVTAPATVPLLYGHGWEHAVLPTQILVAAGAATAVGTGIGPLMMAAGRPRALLVSNLLSLVTLGLVVVVCSGHGLTATCAGVAVYRVLNLVVTQYFLATRIVGISLRETLIDDPGPAAISSLALVLCAKPVFGMLHGWPAPLAVLVTTLAGAVTYCTVLRTAFPGAAADVALVARGMAPRWLTRPHFGPVGHGTTRASRALGAATDESRRPPGGLQRSVVHVLAVSRARRAGSEEVAVDGGAPSRRMRVAWLDGLRGAAALFVVLHHMWLRVWPAFPQNVGPWWLGWLLYGHLAVAVFIVVSGFSLALAPVRDGGQLNGGWRRFVRRRAWRILPPYWVALVFSTIIFASLLSPHEPAREIVRAFVVHGALVQDMISSRSPNGAFWSIAVEWQIYFAFLLMLVAARVRGFAVAIAATVAVVFGAHVVGYAGQPWEKVNHLTPQMLALFALGVGAVSLAARGISPTGRRLMLAGTAASLAGLAAVALAYGSGWMVAHYFYVDIFFGGCVASLLCLLQLGAGQRAQRALSWRPMLALGRMSYSLYLVHAPLVIVLYKYIFGRLAAPPVARFGLFIVAGVPSLVAVSYAFHVVFEAPFMNHRNLRSLMRRVRPGWVEASQCATRPGSEPVAPERPAAGAQAEASIV